MKPSDLGAARRRLIAIQFAILASLAAFYFLYLPYRTKSRAVAEAEEREQKIEALFQSLVVEDTHAEVEPAETGGKVHTRPQRLNSTPAVDEVVQALGEPDRRMTDFHGGLHMTWTGTTHSLEASFDHGRLYCLRWGNLQTGHGALVFESSAAWRPF